MVDATGYTGNRHSDQAFGKFPPIYRPDEPNPHECTGSGTHYVGRKVGFVGHSRGRERHFRTADASLGGFGITFSRPIGRDPTTDQGGEIIHRTNRGGFVARKLQQGASVDFPPTEHRELRHTRETAPLYSLLHARGSLRL